MRKFKYLTISFILVMTLSLAGTPLDAAARPLTATSPTLAVLVDYSVLGGQAVTNANATTTSGNVGVSPGTSITGFPPGIAGGDNNTHLFIPPEADPAQAETLSVFGALAQTCDLSFPDATDLSTADFSAVTGGGVGSVPPGVYCSDGSFFLTTTLDLTGSGVWIFRTVSTLITSSGSSVTGGDPCNVWWRIGSSSTLGTTTSFIGTVISQEGVNAMQSGATLNGRFLGLSPATVTLDNNTISTPLCQPPGGETQGGGQSRKPQVGGLPNTGGAPIQNDVFPWSVVILGGVIAGALILGARSYRRTHLPKQ
jgi:hypothetical protein